MKKILFNDEFLLTQAVLDGRKTQTRRVIKIADYDVEYLDSAFDWDLRESVIIDEYARYKVGDVIAVAQSYNDANVCFIQCDLRLKHNHIWGHTPNMKGWNNKMFVQADIMPHQILITNVRIERLQEISVNDCLAEGIEFDGKAQSFYCGFNASTNSKIWLGSTPREAYAELIEKVSGKGTWKNNPYVFVYDFELIK